MSKDARWSTSARILGLGLASGFMLAWALGLGRAPEVRAQGQAPSGADSGTIAFTTTSSGPNGAGQQYLYVIDTKTQAFAVYCIDPSNPKGAVKLEAARQYRWDLKLAEFNNQAPPVATIEAMVGNPAPAPRR
jgi:hypothetical protein